MSDNPTNEQAAAHNADLRNQIDAERRQLEADLAAVRQQATGGLTDEDVRRAEHPDEFAHEDTAAPAEDAAEPASTAPVAPALETGHNLETSSNIGNDAAGTLALAPAGTPRSPSEAAAAADSPTVEPTPDAPQEPAQEPAGADPAELSLLERLEADARALRGKLFGPPNLGSPS